MGYWGNVDKKSIVNILDNGIDFLKTEVKNKEKSIDILWQDYRRLDKLLYGDGDRLLSITNKERFEKRLNTVKKILEKGF